MKKTILSAIIAIIMIASLVPCCVSAMWDGTSYATPLGDGSEGNPYSVTNEAELAGLAKMVNDGDTLAGKYVVLEADLNLGDYDWTPIGTSTSAYFAGNFDGKNHTITGIKVNVSIDYAGLFGLVKNGKVENLIIENANVTGAKYAAPLIGMLQATKQTGYSLVRNCHVTNSVTKGVQAASLVGRASTTGATPDQMIVEYCSAVDCKIDGTRDSSESATTMYAGGIMSAAGSVTIRYCWTENEEITIGGNASAVYAGGLLSCQGASSAAGDVQNCYTTGTSITVIDGTTCAAEKCAIAGLIGKAGHTNCSSHIQNCFVIGAKLKNVDGAEYTGALMGVCNNWVTYNNCSTDSDTAIGYDALLQDYPVTKMNTDEFGLAGAAEKLNLAFNNTKAVWKDDTIAGHPVIDFDAISDNVFTAVSWDELTTADTTEAGAPDDTTPDTTKAETVDTAPETEAETTAAGTTADTTAEATRAATDPAGSEKGCGSSVACACAMISVLGCALLLKKKN